MDAIILLVTGAAMPFAVLAGIFGDVVVIAAAGSSALVLLVAIFNTVAGVGFPEPEKLKAVVNAGLYLGFLGMGSIALVGVGTDEIGGFIGLDWNAAWTLLIGALVMRLAAWGLDEHGPVMWR